MSSGNSLALLKRRSDINYNGVLDYIPIYTADQLHSIGASDDYPSNGVYKLMRDIDLSGYEWTPKSINYGTFDGNNKCISNLSITSTSDGGLFSSAVSATISNLTMDGCSISVSIYTSAGAIAPTATKATISGCKIKNCTISGGYYVGGIAGYVGDVGAQISYCSVSESSITGTSRAGGIAGYVQGTTSYCYTSDCTITASSGYAGGILGEAGPYGGNIESSYSVNCDIYGYISAGGLLGTFNSFVVSTINASYAAHSSISGGSAGLVIGRCNQTTTQTVPIVALSIGDISVIGDDSAGDSTALLAVTTVVDTIEELNNAVIASMGSYFTAGEPTTTNLPSLFGENLKFE